MGTSQSSGGSPSGVPMFPPWVPNTVPPADAGGDGDAATPSPEVPPAEPGPLPTPVPIAPAGRFGSARTRLGQYARTGSQNDMRAGLGSYVGKGWQGARSAAHRLRGSARTAGSLYGALSMLAGAPTPAGSPLDPALLQGKSTDQVINAVIEAARPGDGTQDAEASRHAIHTALSELLERTPDADLFNLSDDERFFVIERFLAADVFNRIELDLGAHIQEKAPNCAAAVSRLKEIKNYVRQTVSAAFRKLVAEGAKPTAQRIAAISRQAIQDAFAVFEGYA